jgi:hypothetical protein
MWSRNYVFLCNQKLQYRVHKNPSLDTILRYPNSVHTLMEHLSIHAQVFQVGLFSWGFPSERNAFTISPRVLHAPPTSSSSM